MKINVSMDDYDRVIVSDEHTVYAPRTFAEGDTLDQRLASAKGVLDMVLRSLNEQLNLELNDYEVWLDR